MTIKVVKVDFNGTIIDDWKTAYAGSCAVLEYYGFSIPSFDEYVRTLALTGDYYGYYAQHGNVGTRDEVYKIFIQAYNEHASEVKVFEGVYRALDSIMSAGIEIQLVTAAREDFAGPLVSAIGIDIFLTEKFFHVLDKSEAIERTLISKRIEPCECVMIGDLPSDIRHSKKAGIIGVAWLNRDVPRDVFNDVYDMDYATVCWLDFAKYVIEK